MEQRPAADRRITVDRSGQTPADPLEHRSAERTAHRSGGVPVPLVILTVLFAGRVVAQLVQAVDEVTWLPPFDAWQSGALPYPILLISQAIILVVQVRLIRRSLAGRFDPGPRTRGLLAGIGAAYALTMAVRLGLGATVLDGHRWFDAPLPSIFHVVLATFLLILVRPTPAPTGARPTGNSAADRLFDGLTYPAVMVGAVLLLLVGVAVDLPAAVAAYVAVAVGAVAITGLEVVRPHRATWQPDRRTVVNDAVFLVIVQMLLPTLVSAAVVFGLSALVGDGTPLRSWWPHGWPAVAQVVLMLALGDVLRYWLHRAFHTWQPMWAFHAVHHSPDRLYWLNVGRFHPFEKVGQLALDSLPFVIVGVGDDVLAGYFVFYAVNGFFQHSNCRVRLGPLNWIISGPELHRWHHSRVIAESNNNYGNNLIVWDVLFGTRFLPDDREVAELGLINRDYPDGFGAQLFSVFQPGLDKTPAQPAAPDPGGAKPATARRAGSRSVIS